MKEYIDKEKAIQILTDSSDAYGTFSVERSIYLAARQKVKNIPAADVAEVRYGEWILVRRLADGGEFKCSACERLKRFDSFDRKENNPYCNCGAKMDGWNENGID